MAHPPRCPRCNFALTGLPLIEGKVTCPECGRSSAPGETLSLKWPGLPAAFAIGFLPMFTFANLCLFGLLTGYLDLLVLPLFLLGALSGITLPFIVGLLPDPGGELLEGRRSLFLLSAWVFNGLVGLAYLLLGLRLVSISLAGPD